jgi:exosortase N
LLLFILAFISPVFQYFMNVFSFPIRLCLTGWAGSLLNVFNGKAVVEGNTIIFKGNEYSVDPACMGLNMLLLSMIISIALTAHYYRINKKTVSVVTLGLVLGSVLLLNIVSNLLRIIFMVQFAIPPGTIAHDLNGIIFFLVYVITPLRFIIKRVIVKKLGKSSESTHTLASPWPVRMRTTLHGVLLILVFFGCWKSKTHNTVSDMPDGQDLIVSGYKVQPLPFHTIKLEKESALVYIKFVEAFYNADHTPYICWRGSGYQFRNIRKENIGGLEVYGGKLEKNKETLFTAWWYQHNNDCTLNQFSWRWKMLKGDGNYALVNVTARTREELVKEIMFISRNKPFIHLLN